ncbi:hypothetical protein O181_043505 [Austropuccinia psidii MF-1]|uniref:Uncharacterized protein n=1 Tax=Austropuccinia psidii MF-1 TaxID=1389203 RepID=A0A9Q3DIH0_9BASI|nr:hypothetical protein [Austropuccinia psidii MF-1]
MEDARASTSSQRLASTFDTLIEIPEADITFIPVVRPESFSNRQQLKYTSLNTRTEVHGPRKDRGSSEGLETNVLQSTSPTDKSLVEKPQHVFRGPEEVVPRKGQQPIGSSPSLNKYQKRASKPVRTIRRASKPQRTIRRARKRQRERQSPSGTSLTHRTTEFPRKRR